MDCDDTEARLWLVADKLFRAEHPHRGPLIRAKRTVRSKYLRLALLAYTTATDRHGASWDEARKQAAADYAKHCACVHVQDPLRYYQPEIGD
jgi:hypothetical protein